MVPKSVSLCFPKADIYSSQTLRDTEAWVHLSTLFSEMSDLQAEGGGSEVKLQMDLTVRKRKFPE